MPSVALASEPLGLHQAVPQRSAHTSPQVRPPPQPADGITAMDLSDDEIAVARLPNEVAFGIDASSRVEVGSLHDVLL